MAKASAKKIMKGAAPVVATGAGLFTGIKAADFIPALSAEPKTDNLIKGALMTLGGIALAASTKGNTQNFFIGIGGSGVVKLIEGAGLGIPGVNGTHQVFFTQPINPVNGADYSVNDSKIGH